MSNSVEQKKEDRATLKRIQKILVVMREERLQIFAQLKKNEETFVRLEEAFGLRDKNDKVS